MVPCPVVIILASSGSRWEKIQRPIASHYAECVNYRLRGLTDQGVEGFQELAKMKAIRKTWSTETTKQVLYGLTKTEAANM